MADTSEVPEAVVRLYLGPGGKHHIQTMIAQELTRVAEIATATATAATPTRKRPFRIPPGLGLLTPRKSFWNDNAPTMLLKLREADEVVCKLSNSVQELRNGNANDRERRQVHSHQNEKMEYLLRDVMKSLDDVQKAIAVALDQFKEEEDEKVI